MCGESMDILKHLQILYSVILCVSHFLMLYFWLKLKVLGEQVVSKHHFRTTGQCVHCKGCLGDCEVCNTRPYGKSSFGGS